MCKFLFFLLLFLKTQVIMASEPVLMSFCHKNKGNLQHIKTQLSFIKNPEDILFEQGFCLDIKTIRSREDLYFKFIKIKFPLATITSSADFNNKDQCHIELKKITNRNSKIIDIGNNHHKASLQDTVNSNLKTEILSLKVQQNYKTKVIVDDSYFHLICIKRKNLFNIKTFTTSNEFSFQSQLTISPNMWTELGKITKNQKEENKSIAIKTNQYNNIDNQNTVTILLKIR